LTKVIIFYIFKAYVTDDVSSEDPEKRLFSQGFYQQNHRLLALNILFVLSEIFLTGYFCITVTERVGVCPGMNDFIIL
jgi:hypothetical protein